MSRCLPYPPPGYEAQSRDESLIGSLKLQSEKKREKRKEKKEREKREKKVKYKECGKLEEKKSSSEEKRSQINQERSNHKKRRREEIEQLERSSITEEHGHPTGPHCSNDSSDSAECSGKRKKQNIGAEASHNQGNGLRIRFSLPKPRDQEPSPSCNAEKVPSSSGIDYLAKELEMTTKYPLSSTVQACSSSRANHPTKKPAIIACELPTNRDSYSRAADHLVKEPNTTSELPSNKEQTSRAAEEAATSSKHGSRRTAKLESRFRDLFANWKPTPLQTEHADCDDLEWLFERKLCYQVATQHKGSRDSSIFVTSSLGPHAVYLPTADVYALPFAIPY